MRNFYKIFTYRFVIIFRKNFYDQQKTEDFKYVYYYLVIIGINVRRSIDISDVLYVSSFLILNFRIPNGIHISENIIKKADGRNSFYSK